MVDPEDTVPEVEDKMTDVIERSLMFHPGKPADNRTIKPRKSWTVYAEDGSELFTTESESFLRWWEEGNVKYTIKETTT